MMKKAQAQIITTVLIILLVLAAIVIVWQVVSGTIEEGGEAIESQTGCTGMVLEVSNIDNTPSCTTVQTDAGECTDKTTCETAQDAYNCGGLWLSGKVTVRRGQGNSDITVTGFNLFKDGENIGTTTVNLAPLATNVVNIDEDDIATIATGDEFSAGAIIGSTICNPLTTTTTE